jgi:hypothetical protein
MQKRSRVSIYGKGRDQMARVEFSYSGSHMFVSVGVPNGDGALRIEYAGRAKRSQLRKLRDFLEQYDAQEQPLGMAAGG